MSDVTICPHCHPNTKFVSMFARGYYLVNKDGKYAIAAEPCHRDDIIYTWPFTPVPQPQDEESEEHEGWFNQVYEYNGPEMSLLGAYFFVGACMEVGFDQSEHGDIRFWLADRAGKLIEAAAK